MKDKTGIVKTLLLKVMAHGYEINKTLSELGFKRLGPATLYSKIYELVNKKVIEEVSAPHWETDNRRKYFRIKRSK